MWPFYGPTICARRGLSGSPLVRGFRADTTHEPPAAVYRPQCSHDTIGLPWTMEHAFLYSALESRAGFAGLVGYCFPDEGLPHTS